MYKGVYVFCLIKFLLFANSLVFQSLRARIQSHYPQGTELEEFLKKIKTIHSTVKYHPLILLQKDIFLENLQLALRKING